MTVEQFSPTPVQVSPSAPRAEIPKLEIQVGRDFQGFVALNYTYPESIPIWRGDKLPTVEQAFECVRVCQALSNCYQNINLFRYDDSRKIVYIIAGANDGIEVEVYANGIWEFVNDETEF